MIKAVVFDFFGVLAHDGWLPFRQAHFVHNTQAFQEATDLNKRSNAGMLGYEDFLQQVGDLAGVSAAAARTEIEDNPANTQLFTYIQQTLKPHYKIGLLSNASSYHLDDILQPAQLALFDDMVLSYQVGAAKPDEIMYATIAAKLGVLPEECLYIDDQPGFVDGALRAGMQAFVFTTTEEVIQNIQEHLDA